MEITIDSLDNLADALAGLDSNEADLPHIVVFSKDVNISGDDWSSINNTVQSAEKYVILDLSACVADDTISGGFSPSGNNFNIIKDNIYIKGIILPVTLKSIGDCAFWGCTSLKSITIPTGVRPTDVCSIGSQAFYGCTSLTSVTILSSIIEIGESAFSGCTGLESVTILSSEIDIGEHAFEGCTGLTSITIPAGVSIGYCAFEGCTSLKSITIPTGVRSIWESAFYGCTGLESVTIPSSVTSIEYQAFYGCTSLESVIIPASVTLIGMWAFACCASLTSVTFEGNNISDSNFGSWAFPGKNSSSPLYDYLKMAYLAADGGAGTYTRAAGGDVWTKQ